MNTHLRIARIIWAAMTLGMLAFLVIAWQFAPTPAGPAGTHLNTLLLTWGALAASMTMAYIALRIALLGTIRRRWRENPGSDDPVNDLSSHWWVQWLIGAALIEAAGLFATVIVLIQRNDLALGCSAAAIVAMLLWAPSQAALRSFAESVTNSPVRTEPNI